MVETKFRSTQQPYLYLFVALLRHIKTNKARFQRPAVHPCVTAGNWNFSSYHTKGTINECLCLQGLIEGREARGRQSLKYLSNNGMKYRGKLLLRANDRAGLRSMVANDSTRMNVLPCEPLISSEKQQHVELVTDLMCDCNMTRPSDYHDLAKTYHVKSQLTRHSARGTGSKIGKWPAKQVSLHSKGNWMVKIR